jgi:hypothetical protein
VTAPVVYPTGKQTVGVAVEAIPGTPVAPGAWVPVTKFEFNDKPVWLKDMAGRGVMGNDAFAVIQGVLIGELTIEGPVYCDTLGYWLGNLLGDVTTTGTATAPTGTLSAPSIVGATSVSSSVSIPTGTLIQIDVGNLAEIVTTSGVPTGAGPYTIPVPALTKPHASAVAITAITSPNAHAFSLMNSGGGRGQGALSAQPSVHTITQYYGPAATSGARQFTNVVFTEIAFKWNAESDVLTYTAKAIAWVSTIPGSIPAATYTTALPIAAWRGLLGLTGPASGGSQVLTVESGEYTIKRAAKALYTAQGSQNPYSIPRGGVSADWKSAFVAADETPYLYMRNNTQPQYQWVLSNGLTGANALGIQVDMQQAAFTEAKQNQGKEVVGFDCVGSAVFNTTNAGYSGGMSPIKVTLTNAIAAGTYL